VRTVLTGTAAVAALALMSFVAVTTHQESAQALHLRPVGRPSALPLSFATGDATQVITVVAGSGTAASAQLQAWVKVDGGWLREGAPITAHTASGGLTSRPAESVPATPIGSYGLTQAFGKLPDPGTRMPFFRVTAGDWWVSQPGPLYNTHQLCTLECPFVLGNPNTHLIDAVRAYNFALVIDYNRFPAQRGGGSAYFLHVTTAGKPTRGCIAVPQPAMIALLTWLRPAAHPRILIGVAA
jgi:L,D-peptidoglycan transpeptidase YkuD (ErfK/YbiS/YcfS/YnhG family)